MFLRLLRFNNYFLVAFLALTLTGCKSAEERKQAKEASSLRLYIESEFDTTGAKTTVVPVYRASPVLIRVNKEPFLDEGNIVDAEVVDVPGGFVIRVKYDFRGTLTLASVSSNYPGQRMAIFTMFTEGRYIAAPKITNHIKDGVIVFTPDATRAEAERIVRGLNNVAAKLGNRAKPGTEKKNEPPM
jgi:hypothetical protein